MTKLTECKLGSLKGSKMENSFIREANLIFKAGLEFYDATQQYDKLTHQPITHCYYVDSVITNSQKNRLQRVGAIISETNQHHTIIAFPVN